MERGHDELTARREISVAHLLRWTGHDRLDEASARDVVSFLRSRGLGVSPSLFRVLAERGETRWGEPAFDSPGLAVDADRLDEAFVTVSPSRLPALAGAVGVTVIVACIALYRSAPYAVAALAAGFAAVGVVGARRAALDRRLPSAAPRGALLGAGVAVMALSLVFVALVAVRKVTGL
jgi:hypothetical protein